MTPLDHLNNPRRRIDSSKCSTEKRRCHSKTRCRSRFVQEIPPKLFFDEEYSVLIPNRTLQPIGKIEQGRISECIGNGSLTSDSAVDCDLEGYSFLFLPINRMKYRAQQLRHKSRKEETGRCREFVQCRRFEFLKKYRFCMFNIINPPCHSHCQSQRSEE